MPLNVAQYLNFGFKFGYGKTLKSLCSFRHLKIGILSKKQVGYGKIFQKYVQKITASKRGF